jgi:AcrR family transcriptional regulator
LWKTATFPRSGKATIVCQVWETDQIEPSAGQVEVEEIAVSVTKGPAKTAKAATSNGRTSQAKTTAPGARRAKAEDAEPTVAGVPLADLVAVNDGAAGPRSKRSAIIDTAVSRIGESGYEATKWSTVADEVGIGQTALYHYFESKAHCLLTIMRLELAQSYQRFIVATQGQDSPALAVEAALNSAFEVTTAEMRQLRILVSNGDVLANPRQSEREEAERALCLELTHVIEDAWTDLLAKKLASTRDERDARMLARAILGLMTSVWRWYRPGGKIPLAEVSTFYVTSALHITG